MKMRLVPGGSHAISPKTRQPWRASPALVFRQPQDVAAEAVAAQPVGKEDEVDERSAARDDPRRSRRRV
jgi:hypothetical protein